MRLTGASAVSLLFYKYTESSAIRIETEI